MNISAEDTPNPIKLDIKNLRENRQLETNLKLCKLLKQEQGTAVIFESMKHFHGVHPAHGEEDRYTAPIWYTSQPEQMELQTHGGHGTTGQ